MKSRIEWFRCAVAATLLCVAVAPQLHAGTSVLIWPLDPTIEAGQRAASIWLENVGNELVTLQIRVLGWNQHDYQDDYSAQQGIIATPPFTKIAAGNRQLVRLTMLQPASPGREQAYRILVDEIPIARAVEDGAAQRPAGALRFQMRYSLPLFVYGAGLRGEDSSAARHPSVQRAQPQLSWSIDETEAERYLYVRNSGSGHARLSRVRLNPVASQSAGPPADAMSIDVAAGLLGYVLPGAQMRWPLTGGPIPDGYSLQAQLRSNSEPVSILLE